MQMENSASVNKFYLSLRCQKTWNYNRCEQIFVAGVWVPDPLATLDSQFEKYEELLWMNFALFRSDNAIQS